MDMLEVDMFAEARNAQLDAQTIAGPGSVKAIAPAKVNLFLGIGAKRPDGYHDLVTVFHALALHDTLALRCVSEDGTVETARERVRAAVLENPDDAAAAADALPPHEALVGPAKNLLVGITGADKTEQTVRALAVPARDNLVVRALDALAHKIGYNADERITVHLEKNIPMQAGLGGGSADAAATLLTAARFWGVASDGPTLHEVAAGLGADVAFFLEGGCALMEGAGERLETRLEPAKLPVVLVKPAQGVSTAACYARFDEGSVPVPAQLLAQAEDAKLAADVPLFNNLAPAAESLCPELAQVRTWLQDQLGVPDENERVLLCGSGSCTFAVADDFSQAVRIAAAAQAQGWWSRATSLSSLKAAIA